MTFPKSHQIPLVVTTFDMDGQKRMRPSAILRYQQEVGERHLREAGLGLEALWQRGMAFLLTQVCVHIHRIPMVEDALTLFTQSYGVRGAQFIRCYRFFDETGTPVIESTSVAALVDVVSHKILRPAALNAPDFPVNCGELWGCPLAKRLHRPDSLSPCGCRSVFYSDTDQNGHLNNTVYGDFLVDFLPDSLRQRPLSSFQIHYAREAHLGDSLSFASHSNPDGTFFLCANHDRGICFDALCSFAQEA